MIYHEYVWPGARFGQHAAFYCSLEITLKFSYGTGRRVNVTLREPLTQSCCKFKPGEKKLWSTEASSATAPSLPRSFTPLLPLSTPPATDGPIGEPWWSSVFCMLLLSLGRCSSYLNVTWIRPLLMSESRRVFRLISGDALHLSTLFQPMTYDDISV